MVFDLGYFWIDASAILRKFIVDKDFKLVEEAVGKDKVLVGSSSKKRKGTCGIACLVAKKMKECERKMEFLWEGILARGMDGVSLCHGLW